MKRLFMHNPKVCKPVRKGCDPGLRFLQTSQEVQPVRGRLDEEFSRPLEGLYAMATVLLTRPAISGCLEALV